MAVVAAREQFGVTERRACRVVGQPRSTQRLRPPCRRTTSWRSGPSCGTSPGAVRVGAGAGPPGRHETPAGGQPQADPPPVARRRPACALSQAQEATAGIGVAWAPSARSGRAWCGPWTSSSTRLRRQDPQVLERDRRVHPRTLATDVERSIDADAVVGCLERLAAERGAPAYVRFDHGPEFIAYAVADWCRFNSTGMVFIDPGSPWQNAWIESFNGRMCDELAERPAVRLAARGQGLHRGLEDRLQRQQAPQRHGWLTPVEFVEAWLHRQAHQLA